METTHKPKAVFLDRDGVLIRDSNLITDASEMVPYPDVPLALDRLKNANFLLIVVTNQTVISRGLIDEPALRSMHESLNQQLGGRIDAVYYCPHHPNANVEAYRSVCACRKPEPGMLLRAASEHDIELSSSWMIGDRPSDILAGQRAGCHTILLETGAHLCAPIQSPTMPADLPKAEYVRANLSEAAELILHHGKHNHSEGVAL